MMNPKRILVVRLDRLGDVILSTPVIKNLRRAFPEAYIALMVQSNMAEAVRGNPNLNEVIAYDKSGKESSLFGFFGFIKVLRDKRFDLALILHPTLRTHMTVFLAGIPHRVGYDRKWGNLLTRRLPHMKQLGLKHEIDYTLDVLDCIGISANSRESYIHVSQDIAKSAEKLLKSGGIDKVDTFIAINPGASCQSKRWSPQRFAQTGDALAGAFGAKVVIVCGAEERPIADAMVAAMRTQAVNLAGKTTVCELAAVLMRARLFISNDSGPVHVACAVGTPTIAIFGRNDSGLSPRRWGPTGLHDIVLHKDVGCDLCMAHRCDIGFKCLEAISVDEVVAAASSVLGKARSLQQGQG